MATERDNPADRTATDRTAVIALTRNGARMARTLAESLDRKSTLLIDRRFREEGDTGETFDLPLRPVVEQAYKRLGRGGTAVVVGVADPKDKTSLTTLTLPADERTLKGSWLGSARPQHDFPRILGLYKARKLKLDELVTRTYPIEEAAQAFDDMVAGKNARGVIVFE